MTEVDGIVEFEDVVEGVSVVEAADEATGITNRVIIDWRSNTSACGTQAGDRHQGR